MSAGAPPAGAPPAEAPPAAGARASAGGRLAFVDRLRGLATVAMIEVHVVNALLAPEFRQGRAFAALDFVNGLVAPSFLVAAGLSLARSFAPDWPASPARRRLAARHARRAALLLAAGYAMRSTRLAAALASSGPARAAAWVDFLQVDVLQLIAASLAGLALVAALAGSARRFAAAASALAVACAWLGPAAHLDDWAGWPAGLAAYVTGRFGSPFPLLPWASFVAAGAALGAAGTAQAPSGAWAKRLLGVSAAALAAYAASAAAPWPAGGAFEPWAVAPSAVALRFGLVGLAAAALAARPPAAPAVSPEGAAPGPPAPPRRGPAERLLALFGRHSLFVYVAHIVIVYGRNPLSLRTLLGPTLGPLACAATWAAVTAAMALGARALAGRRARPAAAPPGPPTPRPAP